jgi:hypothetical protein
MSQLIKSMSRSRRFNSDKNMSKASVSAAPPPRCHPSPLASTSVYRRPTYGNRPTTPTLFHFITARSANSRSSASVRVLLEFCKKSSADKSLTEKDLALQSETRCWGPFDCSRQVTARFIVVNYIGYTRYGFR